MGKHIMLVFTNAEPGEDDAFNRWYDDRHLPDILEQGPFTAAHRFRLAADVGTDAPYRYLAVYDVEEGRLEEARAWILFTRAEREEALAAGREPLVPISPVLSEDRVAWFFETISERQAAPATA